mmetsp:Transcript_17192/g.20465  ORF Transcript_17192/g.20465 Transcript_17192/m.20465 type:complete len:90 (+) Transcript_17192:20-289(+)
MPIHLQLFLAFLPYIYSSSSIHGLDEGDRVGIVEGTSVGILDGTCVGLIVGATLGNSVGNLDGIYVGLIVGDMLAVGTCDGMVVTFAAQ